MAIRHLRIHGDNIIECERTLTLLSNALDETPKNTQKGPVWMPEYMLCNIQVDLLPGHGRWGVDIAGELEKAGGILRESADSYVTEISQGAETVLFALEYCSALPAGNNAWQRNGRALSCALAGVPYLYIAEIGGVELDENRNVKSPRFPNPVVPFSYLALSQRLNISCLPIYTAYPSITDALFEKYNAVFGMGECLELIESIVNDKDCTQCVNILKNKALDLVKMLAHDRRTVDTLRDSEWKRLLANKNSALWLQRNSDAIIWKKKTASKVLTTRTFDMLFSEVTSYNCVTLGSKDLPICIIPKNKQSDFVAFLKKLYPLQRFSFKKSKPIAIVWVTGFKPRGDDSRPDRGLSSLAKMILGDSAQIMAVVYGPAKKSTWEAFMSSPKGLAQENGLWQSILNLCDFVLIDSTTSKDKVFYKTNAKLESKSRPVSFNYVAPTIAFSEHDTDTSIHQLFSRRESDNVFECLCNPPGGDWSGVSYYSDSAKEYRWTSLPRVSAIGGKRPDHIIQLKNASSDVFVSIESKLKGKDLENEIGLKLKSYLDDLFHNPPTAYRTREKDWRLYEAQTLDLRQYSIISAGAFEFESISDMREQMKRGKLDMVFAFEFNDTTILHVVSKANNQFKNVLKQLQLGVSGLEIQIH